MKRLVVLYLMVILGTLSCNRGTTTTTSGKPTVVPAALRGATPSGVKRGSTVTFTLTGVNISEATRTIHSVFNGLNDRFAIYRGRVPSVRDMAFTLRTTGGFTPQVMTLLSTVVAPQSIQFLQQPEEMAVVDGASQGLSLFSLDTFGIVTPSPFY